MGNSPRVIPTSYGKSLNGCKKMLRDYVYGQIARSLQKDGYVLVDLDLKSCYRSILIGLYPDLLEHLQRTHLKKASDYGSL